MVMNILVPDEGRILSEGRPLDNSFRNRVGYLPEDRGLYGDMKVIDHLMFFGTLKDMSRIAARKQGLDWLDRLGLGDRAQAKVKELSKGMQQKIQFAGTLLHDPDIILMDEPFSGLDPVNTESLKDIMMEMRGRGKTVIFSTHMMDHAERLCDEIVLIDDGHLVLSGSMGEVRESFGHGHLRVRFRGDGSLLRRDGRVAECRDLSDGDMELRLHDEKDIPDVARDWSAKLDLVHFEPVIPSLHNIFMQTVKRDKSKETGGVK
jgi:ABC-2 type transport system ATP-binding protein